jgi:hypothetical protein
MKGTFFSADFVTDKNDNLRLIEINTDTGIVSSQTGSFDWTDFINILNTNNITEVDVIYKHDIQKDIVSSLSSSLNTNAPFVTSFNKTIVASDSIFPPTITDGDNKFILRMAYDETAILDSEYAKGTLGLLTLFANAGDSGSITNFYHSSSLYGEYNTLDTNIFNGNTLPDIVSKTVIEQHIPHKFYKIGNSESSSVDRYNNFINHTAGSDNILQQYHINQSNIDTGVATSIRSFQIVYGSNLDLCYVSQYEINSVFDLPSSINYDDSVIDNLIQSKHYYEFATNTIKNINFGILDDENIVDVNDNIIPITNLVVGNSYKSYFVSGSPDTLDYDVLAEWNYSGTDLPSGSYMTSSVLSNVYIANTYANDMTEITFENSSDIVVGGETRMLVYDEQLNDIRYVRVYDMVPDRYYVFGQNDTKLKITNIDLVIYDEQQSVYTLSFEDIHNFILENGTQMSFFVAHNLGITGTCFVAGTKVTLEGGTTKNIEDVVEGDEVISFNETSLIIEPKKVIGLNSPIHNDLVTYHFSNDTSLTCTFDHPIYVNGLELASFIPEWTNNRYNIGKQVNKIKVGDLVRLATAGQTSIKKIEILKPEDTQTYIITVEDNHNFYANNILVHNK